VMIKAARARMNVDVNGSHDGFLISLTRSSGDRWFASDLLTRTEISQL
jgi:hypothetical protein